MDTISLREEERRPIVIIGAGGIVKDAHLPAYRQANLRVAAIYDTSHEKAVALAREFNISVAATDFQELLEIAENKKAVFDMAVPADQILSVLPRLPDGSAVLIQKPMGNNLEEAQAILDMCRQKRLVAGINFQLRHAPYIREARRLIEQGAIGELHDVDVRLNVHTPWQLWDFLYGLPRVEILYHSIHYIDMIRYFLGEPQRVMAKTTRHPRMADLASVRSAIIMDYGDMVRANINTNHGHLFDTTHQESYFKLEGTQGAIKITVGVYLDYPRGKPDTFEFISLNDSRGWQQLPLRGSWFPDAFAGPMLGLMKKVADPAFHYINSVEDAWLTMKWVEKCYQSSEGK